MTKLEKRENKSSVDHKNDLLLEKLNIQPAQSESKFHHKEVFAVPLDNFYVSLFTYFGLPEKASKNQTPPDLTEKEQREIIRKNVPHKELINRIAGQYNSIRDKNIAVGTLYSRDELIENFINHCNELEINKSNIEFPPPRPPIIILPTVTPKYLFSPVVIKDQSLDKTNSVRTQNPPDSLAALEQTPATSDNSSQSNPPDKDIQSDSEQKEVKASFGKGTVIAPLKKNRNTFHLLSSKLSKLGVSVRDFFTRDKSKNIQSDSEQKEVKAHFGKKTVIAPQENNKTFDYLQSLPELGVQHLLTQDKYKHLHLAASLTQSNSIEKDDFNWLFKEEIINLYTQQGISLDLNLWTGDERAINLLTLENLESLALQYQNNPDITLESPAAGRGGSISDGRKVDFREHSYSFTLDSRVRKWYRALQQCNTLENKLLARINSENININKHSKKLFPLRGDYNDPNIFEDSNEDSNDIFQTPAYENDDKPFKSDWYLERQKKAYEKLTAAQLSIYKIRDVKHKVLHDLRMAGYIYTNKNDPSSTLFGEEGTIQSDAKMAKLEYDFLITKGMPKFKPLPPIKLEGALKIMDDGYANDEDWKKFTKNLYDTISKKLSTLSSVPSERKQISSIKEMFSNEKNQLVKINNCDEVQTLLQEQNNQINVLTSEKSVKETEIITFNTDVQKNIDKFDMDIGSWTADKGKLSDYQRSDAMPKFTYYNTNYHQPIFDKSFPRDLELKCIKFNVTYGSEENTVTFKGTDVITEHNIESWITKYMKEKIHNVDALEGLDKVRSEPTTGRYRYSWGQEGYTLEDFIQAVAGWCGVKVALIKPYVSDDMSGFDEHNDKKIKDNHLSLTYSLYHPINPTDGEDINMISCLLFFSREPQAFLDELISCCSVAINHIMAAKKEYVIAKDKERIVHNESLNLIESKIKLAEQTKKTIEEEMLPRLRREFVEKWIDPSLFDGYVKISNPMYPDVDPLVDLINWIKEHDSSNLDVKINNFSFVGSSIYSEEMLNMDDYLRISKVANRDSLSLAVFPAYRKDGTKDEYLSYAVLNPYPAVKKLKIPKIKFVETYEVKTEYAGFALGELSHTLNLIPGEKRTIIIEKSTNKEIKDMSNRSLDTNETKTSTTNFEENIEDEISTAGSSNQENESDWALSAVTKLAQQDKFTKTTSEEENLNVDTSVSASIAPITASVDVKYANNDKRTTSKDHSTQDAYEASRGETNKFLNKESKESSAKNIRNSISKIASETSRNNKVSFSTSSDITSSSSFSKKETMSLQNPNLGRSVNYHFFQIQNKFLTSSNLIDVKVVVDFGQEVINGSHTSDVRVYELECIGKIFYDLAATDYNVVLCATIARQAIKNYMQKVDAFSYEGNGALSIEGDVDVRALNKLMMKECMLKDSPQGKDNNQEWIENYINELHQGLEYLKGLSLKFHDTKMFNPNVSLVNTGGFHLDSDVGHKPATERYLEDRRDITTAMEKAKLDHLIAQTKAGVFFPQAPNVEGYIVNTEKSVTEEQENNQLPEEASSSD